MLADKIQLRRDSLANWTAQNPVLDAGEVGIVLDNFNGRPSLYKIGDGYTAWNQLNAYSNFNVETILDTRTSSSNVWTGNTCDSTITEGKVVSFILNIDTVLYRGSKVSLALTINGGLDTITSPIEIGTVVNSLMFSKGTAVYLVYLSNKWYLQSYSQDNVVLPVSESQLASMSLGYVSVSNRDFYGFGDPEHKCYLYINRGSEGSSTYAELNVEDCYYVTEQRDIARVATYISGSSKILIIAKQETDGGDSNRILLNYTVESPISNSSIDNLFI